jgi:hypothetical protein
MVHGKTQRFTAPAAPPPPQRPEDSRIDTALLLDHEPHLASRGDRRDEAHAMRAPVVSRRFVLLAPTTPRVQIPVHRGQSFRHIADSVPVIADSFS